MYRGGFAVRFLPNNEESYQLNNRWNTGLYKRRNGVIEKKNACVGYVWFFSQGAPMCTLNLLVAD